jgi:hypothetical protein
MNAMPYAIFILEATVEDDHYDEPGTKEELEADFRDWAKKKHLKLKAVHVAEYLRGVK